MTFRHINFEDSSTMRSLEKVAREKGWVGETPLSKIASLEENDLSASANLTENILKLCSGLRDSGQGKYADELESRFITYKKAQTLYETSKETGEDLIDFAHPKGSHKLEGFEGDAVIETVIDQHLAFLKMIEKKPTGKLSSSSEILKAVKNVVAQDYSGIKSNVNSAWNQFQKLKSVVNPYLTREVGGLQDWIVNWMSVAGPFVNDYNGKMNTVKENPTFENINAAVDNLSRLENRLKPGLYGLPKESQVWSDAQAIMAGIKNSLNEALKLSELNQKEMGSRSKEKYDTSKSSEVQSDSPGGASNFTDIVKKTTQNAALLNSPSSVLSKWIANAKSVLNGWSAKINTDPDLNAIDKGKAGKWISDKLSKVSEIDTQFQALTQQEKDQQASMLLSNLKKITSPFGQFKKTWID